MKITRIEKVKVAGPHSLELEFSDGLRKTVNVLPLLRGRIFEPLLEPAFFAKVLLDPVAGTVVWPNGADLAPEALHALPDDGHPKARSRKPPRQRPSRKTTRR